MIIDLSGADITNISIGDAGLVGYSTTPRPTRRTDAMKYHRFGRTWPGGAARRGYPIRGLHVLQIDGENATDVTAGIYRDGDNIEDQVASVSDGACEGDEPE